MLIGRFFGSRLRMTDLRQGPFDRCFLSYEMSLLKPDPAYFRHMLDSLQVDAGDCLFIDDRPENVQSAKAMVINAFVFESVDKLKSDFKRVL